jgi:NAD dependent epimerase/dehydratase family enzyme
VTNRQFIRTSQRLLGRFPLFALPAIALRAALGEMSSVVLDSQRLVPQRLTEEGFPFAYPELDRALRHLLAANEPSL